MNSFPLIDLHEDLLLHLNYRQWYGDHYQTSFEMLERNDARIVVATAFPVPQSDSYFDPATNGLIQKDFDEYNAHCAANKNWRIIRTRGDVDAVLGEPAQHGIVLHIEGLNVVGDTDWQRLQTWYEQGWRSLGIVWNLTNPLGGGTKDPVAPLTALGEQMIAWLQERHMIVDFAHMNERTFWDVAKMVKGPIIVSHGNARALCNNPRNYTDDQLRHVAESGGVVGVFFARTFVTGGAPATVAHVADHVDHLKNVMGIDHVALGTDFGGIITGLVEGLESLDCMSAFWTELARRGYTDDMMEKIAYRNAARVLHDILV